MPRFDWLCDHCGAEETLNVGPRDDYRDNPSAVNGTCPLGSEVQEYGGVDGAGACRWRRIFNPPYIKVR